MSRIRRMRGALALTVCLALTGCAATAAPASGPSPSLSAEPEALLMAFASGFADAQISLFERALAEESGGGLEIAISDDFALDSRAAEQSMVAAVAAAELDLAWVGARAFSELGVHDFDALVAPLLIDSLATQQAVLDSELPGRMMDGLDSLGVAGLAVIGGPLRRPIAAGEPLTSLDRFAGVSFQAFPGEVSSATVAALGAIEADIAPAERDAALMDGSVRAYENTLALMADNLDTPATTMTLNVDLWPGVGVLIANPETLAKLTPERRDALLAAADVAAERAVESLDPESALVAVVCAQGGSFAFATPEALVALRAAVEPVYDALRADPFTAAAIEEIARIKASSTPEEVPVPADCRVE